MEAIFEACQSDSPGLLLEDVQRKGCIAVVSNIAGEINDDIDHLFEAADTNGDGIVVRSEVKEAFESLSLLRVSGDDEPCETYKDSWGRYRFNCAGSKESRGTSCKKCTKCKCDSEDIQPFNGFNRPGK